MPAGPISAELCVTGRELTEPRTSPDGRWLSTVVASRPAAIVVQAIGCETGSAVSVGPERPLTTLPAPGPGRGLGGGCHHWLPDSSGVVYAAGDGDVWYQPLGVGAPSRLMSAAAVGAESLRGPMVVDGADGRLLMVVVADEASVWAVGLECGDPSAGPGASAPVRLDDGADHFCLDPWVRHLGGDGFEVRWQAWSVPDMPWDGSVTRICEVHGARVVQRRSESGSGAVQQPRALPDGTSVSVRDDTGWLNLWVGDHPVIPDQREHAGPTWGPGQRSYAVSPDGTHAVVAVNEGGFGRLEMVRLAPADGPASSVVSETLARGVHGQLEWRGDVVSALRTGARTPTQVVLYAMGADLGTRTVAMVGPSAAWDAVELPEPELLELTGPSLYARRYAAGEGRLLCMVHGGPTDQWQVTFMPRVLFWWSRGWDVLVVDPRGTTGHGRAHQQALHGGWGLLDVDDTAALIRAAHDRGWAVPGSTLVAGASSGGLTALNLSARPDAPIAGVMVSAPVSDLAGLARAGHRYEAHYGLTLVGPPGAPGYRERSPLELADRIGVPVLITHGDADPVVPVEQSRELVRRLREHGTDVEYREFAGEGHGLRDPLNRRDELVLMASFAERIVSPR